jgi:hypothetical protein
MIDRPGRDNLHLTGDDEVLCPKNSEIPCQDRAEKPDDQGAKSEPCSSNATMPLLKDDVQKQDKANDHKVLRENDENQSKNYAEAEKNGKPSDKDKQDVPEPTDGDEAQAIGGQAEEVDVPKPNDYLVLIGDDELPAGDQDRPRSQAEMDDQEPHDYLELIGDDPVAQQTNATSSEVEDQSENDVAEEYSMLGARGQLGGAALNFPEHPYTQLTEIFRYVDKRETFYLAL